MTRTARDCAAGHVLCTGTGVRAEAQRSHSSFFLLLFEIFSAGVPAPIRQDGGVRYGSDGSRCWRDDLCKVHKLCITILLLNLHNGMYDAVRTSRFRFHTQTSNSDIARTVCSPPFVCSSVSVNPLKWACFGVQDQAAIEACKTGLVCLAHGVD